MCRPWRTLSRKSHPTNCGELTLELNSLTGQSVRTLPRLRILKPVLRRGMPVLLQFGELSLGFFQDRDIGIRILPECEEVFVSCKCASAGGIGIRSLRASSL